MIQEIGFVVGFISYVTGLVGCLLNVLGSEWLYILIIFGAMMMLLSYLSSALGQKKRQAQTMLRVLYLIASLVSILYLADRMMAYSWQQSSDELKNNIQSPQP